MARDGEQLASMETQSENAFKIQGSPEIIPEAKNVKQKTKKSLSNSMIKSKRIREQKTAKEILEKSVFALTKDSPRLEKYTIQKINSDNSLFINEIRKHDVSDTVKEKWCEPIYINCNCRSHNVFKRLHSLPKTIGPGPLSIVIRDTLNLLITRACEQKSIFYKWLCDKHLRKRDDTKSVVIKASTKRIKYYGPARSIHHPEDLAGFCKEMCLKAGVCPNLFGTTQITECPICSDITDSAGSDDSKGINSNEDQKDKQ